jgi:elongation factor P--(R)-beta-lysine ligase
VNTWAVPGTESGAQPDWRPGANLDVLQLRATLLARVRAFFAARKVLEVDTPVLGRGATTDPAIESFATVYRGPGSRETLPLYLQTSPEFFMKRLLAAGSGPIYQLSHVFRNGESGRRHNPEFMLLEWYRPGFSQQTLMDEVDALLEEVLQGHFNYKPARRISYRQWFVDETGLDPWTDCASAFSAFAAAELGGIPDGMPRDELDPWLHLLLSHWLEPRLKGGAVFVYDYPVSQASLACVRRQPVPVAERFELYVNGMELANGFHELAEAGEQAGRFAQDNGSRRAAGQNELPADRQLLAALGHGLPDSAGVAIGFDRLVMLAAGLDDIDAAMAFSLSRS